MSHNDRLGPKFCHLQADVGLLLPSSKKQAHIGDQTSGRITVKAMPYVTISSTMKSSTMDFNVAKIASIAGVVLKKSTISLHVT